MHMDGTSQCRGGWSHWMAHPAPPRKEVQLAPSAVRRQARLEMLPRLVMPTSQTAVQDQEGEKLECPLARPAAGLGASVLPRSRLLAAAGAAATPAVAAAAGVPPVLPVSAKASPEVTEAQRSPPRPSPALASRPANVPFQPVDLHGWTDPSHGADHPRTKSANSAAGGSPPTTLQQSPPCPRLTACARGSTVNWCSRNRGLAATHGRSWTGLH